MPALTTPVISLYQKLYTEKFGIKPTINGMITGSVIKKLLKDHSVRGLQRVIELYFEDPYNGKQAYHLPNILCAASMNKYLPKAKLNPMLYDNAEEENKEIY